MNIVEKGTVLVTVTREYNVNAERIFDVLVTAMEGGSNYWLDHVDHSGVPLPEVYPDWIQENVAPYAWKPLYGQVLIYANDRMDDDDCMTLGPDDLENALERMGENDPAAFERTFVDPIGVDWDADDADVFIQLAIYGEVIYG